jgi:predicted butyrate kinase (DUF1464 family)
VRTLARSGLPVVLTPGVIHLESVPAHRKVNRVDMGTADKVCAAALALREHVQRRRCTFGEAAFVLLELGGAFSAAIAVSGGRIVDGVGGSSGPMGLRAAGALDGEVAFLAGHVPKSMIFTGGAASIADIADVDVLINPTSWRHRLAWDAYIEGAIKAVVSMAASATGARELILSGRMARVRGLRDEIADRLVRTGVRLPVDVLAGSLSSGSQAAEGAALVADGVAGGMHAELVAALGIREARGTVLDHLYVITREQAKKTLGMA